MEDDQTDENEAIDVPSLQVSAVADPSLKCKEPERANIETLGLAGEQLDGIIYSSVSLGENEETIIEYPVQEQGQNAIVGHGGQLCIPSNSTAEDEEIVITSIRATDISLGLRRLPATFSAMLHHNGCEWRTGPKPSSVNNDSVEWNGPIPIPSDMSATICLEVYASYEFEPMLGSGERLRKITVTVEQLWEHSEKQSPFTLFPKDGDVVSPCTSIFIAVKQRNSKPQNDSPSESTSTIQGPHWSIPELPRELESVTDHGHCALSRYRKHGEKHDLERSIAHFERAFSICSLDHPCCAVVQSNLAMAELIHGQVEGLDAPLESALRLFYGALAARPVGHPDRPSTLIHLATVHLVRFQSRKDCVEGQQAQVWLDEALNSRYTENHARQAASLILRQLLVGWHVGLEQSDQRLPVEQDATSQLTDEDPLILTACLLESFEQYGDLDHLQLAIDILQEAVRSTPTWANQYPGILLILSKALLQRFERFGELVDLEGAIERLRDTVNLVPHGHPDKHGSLNNLGYAFLTRFERLSELTDLENAISTLREAIHLTPHDHPDKPCRFQNLGNSLNARFRRLGQLSDLEEAISRLRDAVDLTPHGHPHKPRYLGNLGISLRTRFERFGELSDLEDAISCHRNAVGLVPHHHPNRPSYLGSVACCLTARFQRLGQLSDLEDAISNLRDAVNLIPRGHPEKSMHLNDLGNSLFIRFRCLGEPSDLEDGISSHMDAADLTPHGHPDKPSCLHNLGASLFARFQRFGWRSDLDDAISNQKDAVDLTPHDHPDIPSRLHNLGISLKAHSERFDEPSDLEDAISRLSEAVDLILHDHPEKSNCLNGLAVCLVARFKRFKQYSDLQYAMSCYRDAIELLPHGHAQKSSFLFNLGISFTHFEQIGDMGTLEQAITLFSLAASSPLGPVNTRFCASQKWISCARRIRHPSLLHAYAVALNLLPQLAWVGLSLPHRYALLTQGTDIVREAAAAALDAGFPEAAVEWLERGRSIVWGELFQFRSPYQELTSAYPNHACRLRENSAKLDQACAAREMISEQISGTPHQVAERQRRLALERDELLREIRRLPGFERFLRPKRFSQLRASAHAGPIVILNAAESRCDALIVLADLGHVIHVPLTEFTYKQLSGLQNTMKDFARGPRVGRLRTVTLAPQDTWEHLLSLLWTNVVKPVLDALAFSEPGDLSRIFWCPTGPFAFLPIHAAGLYGKQHSQPGHKLSDFVISSYSPTLGILAPSSNPCTAPISDLRLLAVPQPESDGCSRLLCVGSELDRIREVTEKYPAARTIFIQSSEGTVEEVLDRMKYADWVHFACHGVQDDEDPTQSGLCLAKERRLALSDIIALQRPRGGLAFLSACETAKGYQRLSDEATHIAAGMLFAGYGGVVGTMWTISDHLAPKVAKDVYEYLFRDGKKPDYREAARALHEAVGRARREGASFRNWIPFIHLGL